jgi:hypothetical protein
MKKLALLFLVFVVTALGGCGVGRDFVRPDTASTTLGQTTYAQVVAQMGEPRNVSQSVRNGQAIKTISYVHAEKGDVRSMGYFFYRDVLVGTMFFSSFKTDNSWFDDTRIADIKKGVTTRAEVVQLLGNPTAVMIAPMVKQGFSEAIGYDYMEITGNPLSGMHNWRKTLRIAFDATGKVADIDYSTVQS